VYAFKVSGPKSIRYGMGAIKGVGASAVEAIIEERTANGLYRSSPDLCRRVDLQRVNRRVFEAMIRSGSLDRIGANRASLTAQLDRAVHLGEQNSRAMSVGQVDLFGLSAAEDTRIEEWTDAQRLAGERETLGLFSDRAPHHGPTNRTSSFSWGRGWPMWAAQSGTPSRRRAPSVPVHREGPSGNGGRSRA